MLSPDPFIVIDEQHFHISEFLVQIHFDVLRFIGFIHCISSKYAKHPGFWIYNINSTGYIRIEILEEFRHKRELEEIRNIRLRKF